MRFEKLKIPDVVLITPDVFGDERGFFMETWEQRKFAEAGIDAQFVQDNHSRSSRGTLRGIHYQLQQPQGKLVRVIRGTVYDVAVDLRRSSVTFGQYVGVELSDENKQMLWVPPGFGHGFLTLSETADFVYKCTDFYAPEFERCVAWNDPDIGIVWPSVGKPTLSARDRKGAPLREAELYA